MRVLRHIPLLLLLMSAGAWARAPDDQPDAGADSSSELEKSALEEMLQKDDEEDDPKQQKRDEKDDSKATGAPLAPAGSRGTEAKPQRRGEVSDEIGGGSSASTPALPRAGQLTNNLRGSLYLGEAFTIFAGVNLTLEGGAAPPLDPTTGKPSRFQASYGGTVAMITAGADWDVNDHVSLGVHFDASPSSQQFISTTLGVDAPECPKQQGPVNALIKTQSSSLAAGGTVSYDTAGESNLEAAVTASVTGTDLVSDQRLAAGQCFNQEQGGTLSSHLFTLTQLRAYCATHPRQCALRPALRAVQRDDTFSVLQTRTGLAGTLTVYGDTDLTLGGDYYFYSDDPATLGYFTVRANTLGGEGVPIAPLQWTVRPEVLHRFGKSFSARVWVQAGRYVTNTGGDTASIGTKLQYKFSRAFRMWLTASGQKDTDVDGTQSQSGLVGLGAAYRF